MKSQKKKKKKKTRKESRRAGRQATQRTSKRGRREKGGSKQGREGRRKTLNFRTITRILRSPFLWVVWPHRRQSSTIARLRGVNNGRDRWTHLRSRLFNLYLSLLQFILVNLTNQKKLLLFVEQQLTSLFLKTRNRETNFNISPRKVKLSKGILCVCVCVNFYLYFHSLVNHINVITYNCWSVIKPYCVYVEDTMGERSLDSHLQNDAQT